MKFAPVVTAGRDFIAGPRPGTGPSGGRSQPRITPRLWGVAPPPKSDDPTRRIAHVRNPDSPFWIGNLRNSEFRCLIPATAIMLWGSETDYEGRRLRHWFAPEGFAPEGFAPEDKPIFAMAGVWKDEEVPGFAILMQDPRGISGAAKAAGCRSVPLILPTSDEAHQTWLHGGWADGRNCARTLVERPAPVDLREINTEAG